MSLTKEERAEIETDFEKVLAKWFPPEIDVLTLDGDSRSMKQRIKDVLFSTIDSILEKKIGEIKSEISLHRIDPQAVDWQSPEFGKMVGNNQGLNTALQILTKVIQDGGVSPKQD